MSETVKNDELSLFVASTLNAIAEGAQTAKSGTYKFGVPRKVAFEVAVVARKSSEVGGGFRLQVFSADGKVASQDEAVSKISFEIEAFDTTPAQPLDLSRLRNRA